MDVALKTSETMRKEKMGPRGSPQVTGGKGKVLSMAPNRVGNTIAKVIEGQEIRDIRAAHEQFGTELVGDRVEAVKEANVENRAGRWGGVEKILDVGDDGVQRGLRPLTTLMSQPNTIPGAVQVVAFTDCDRMGTCVSWTIIQQTMGHQTRQMPAICP